MAGCAGWQEPTLETAAKQGPRDKPDDGDLAALVPSGGETVIEVDMEALRRSLWTAEALPDPDARLRDRKAAALGYDGVTDVDRIVYAVTSAGAAAPTIVIAQGRFQTANVEAAFRDRWPNASADKWRGLTTLSSGESALGTLTPRTFCSGAPSQVHAVIDRAFGVGTSYWDPAATPAAPGPLRRQLLAASRFTSPAVLVTVVLDDQLRARVGDAFPLPRELRQVAARVDLGLSLDLQAVGQLDDATAAAELARRLKTLLTDRMTRMALAVLGLSALVQSVQVSAEGTQVRAYARVPPEQRQQVSAALRALVQALRGQDPQAHGSW